MIRLAFAIAFAIAAATSGGATTYFGYTSSSGGVVSGAAKDAHDAFVSSLATTSVQGFDSFAAGTTLPLTVAFSGSAGSISATISGNAAITESFNGLFPTSGAQQIATFDDLTVSFTDPVFAFGFYATDAADHGAPFSITFNNGSLGSYQLANGEVLPDRNIFFFGFTSDTAISSVTLRGARDSDGFGYDDFTVGQPAAAAVPEPATWAMFIAGFGLVGGAMRRRQRVCVRYT